MPQRDVYFFVGRTAHPLYREQFKFAPAGFRYQPSRPDLIHRELKRDISTHGTAREAVVGRARMAAVGALGAGGYIRRLRVRPPARTDLVHSVQFLLHRAEVPYVVDFEDVHVFCMYQRAALRRPWARQRLLASFRDQRCRYLLPWSDAARRGALAALGPQAATEMESRLVTVLPAISPVTDRPRARRPGPFRVLFVGATFLTKGGPEAVEAVSQIRATHEIELDLVTFAPPEWERRITARDYIRLHSRLESAKLRDLFDSADALLFPTHVDTLGFAVLEAKAAALPVVASDHFALPELVEDGVSGLLFPHENSLFGPDYRSRYPWFLPGRPPRRFLRALATPSETYVRQIASQLTRLAEDPELTERLSSGALDRVRVGPLSPDRRRERLAELYAHAIG